VSAATVIGTALPVRCTISGCRCSESQRLFYTEAREWNSPYTSSAPLHLCDCKCAIRVAIHIASIRSCQTTIPRREIKVSEREVGTPKACTAESVHSFLLLFRCGASVCSGSSGWGWDRSRGGSSSNLLRNANESAVQVINVRGPCPEVSSRSTS
jgi:hypothetical protein